MAALGGDPPLPPGGGGFGPPGGWGHYDELDDIAPGHVTEEYPSDEDVESMIAIGVPIVYPADARLRLEGRARPVRPVYLPSMQEQREGRGYSQSIAVGIPVRSVYDERDGETMEDFDQLNGTNVMIDYDNYDLPQNHYDLADRRDRYPNFTPSAIWTNPEYYYLPSAPYNPALNNVEGQYLRHGVRRRLGGGVTRGRGVTWREMGRDFVRQSDGWTRTRGASDPSTFCTIS